MKHCTNCNVDVNENLTNCPLCGAFLSEQATDVSQDMVECEKRWSRPTINIRHHYNFLKTKFNKLCILIMLFVVALNWIVTPSSIWSAYVIWGLLFVMLCIMMPICKATKMRRQIKDDMFLLTLFTISLELIITRLEFTWFSVKYILPWIYVAGIALSDFVLIFIKEKRVGYISTLITCTIFAILPQITVWVAGVFGLNIECNALLAIFFASIFNLVIICVFCSKQLSQEMERNFNL